MQILGKQRSADLDFLRIIATLAVIVIHCSSLLVLSRPVGSNAWAIGNILDSFVRWSVPVFVMISGALLINDKAFKDPRRFFSRRFSRTLLPLVAWPILYAIWLTATGTPFKFENFLFEFLAGNPQPGHLYFLFLIAGLYALTPFISLVAAQLTRRQLWISAISILLVTFVWHAVETFILRGGPPVNFLTQGLPYIGFFMLGYLFWNSSYNPPLKHILIAFVGGSALIMALTLYLVPTIGAEKGFYFYNFPTPLVALTACAAFIGGRQLYGNLAKKLSGKTLKALEQHMSNVAPTTFGIYLVHLMMLSAITLVLPELGKTTLGILALIPLVALVSFIVVVAIRKLPGGKYLLP